MVHLLQKGDSSFNQELLKNMVKSIKMNDVYGPMSQILVQNYYFSVNVGVEP